MNSKKALDELKKLIGEEDYRKIIEPMYMATNLTKEEFVKVIDKKRFALKTTEELINEMKEIAEHLKKTCDHYTDYEAEEKLNKLAEDYKNRIAPTGGYLINTKYTLEHLGYCRGCSYPAEIEIYNSKYQTIEKIKVA